MKKRFKFLSVALAAVALTACNNDDILDTNKGIFVPKGSGLVEVKLAYPGATRAVTPTGPVTGTPEVGTADENAVKSVYFYVFDKNGKMDTYSEYAAAQSSYKFVINNPQDDMKFLVSVNKHVEIGTTAADSTYENVRRLVSLTDTLGYDNSRTAPTNGNYVMAGWTQKSIAPVPTDETEETTVTTPLTVYVDRLISKVMPPVIASVKDTIPVSELENLFGPIDDLDSIKVSKLTLQGYVIINGVSKTDAFYTWNADANPTNKWTDWATANTRFWNKSSFASDGHYTQVYAGTGIYEVGNPAATYLPFTGNDTKVVYVFENMPLDDDLHPTELYDGTTVYSCIIKGEIEMSVWTNSQTTVSKVKTETRYWRANVATPENHKVRRNSIYRMSIETVRTIGHATPEEAEKEPVTKNGYSTVQVSLVVNPWTVKPIPTDL